MGWCWEERGVWSALAHACYDHTVAPLQPCDHIRGYWDKPRFAEFRVSDSEYAGREIDIRGRQAAHFTGPQPREIQHDQRTAENGASQWRPVTAGETLTGLKKATAFGMGKDAGNKGVSVNPEEARPGHRGPLLLQREKATELSDERQAMLSRALGFVAVASDKPADDLHRDHRVIGREPLGEKTIEDTERSRLVVVAIAGGALALKESLNGCGER